MQKANHEASDAVVIVHRRRGMLRRQGMPGLRDIGISTQEVEIGELRDVLDVHKEDCLHDAETGFKELRYRVWGELTEHLQSLLHNSGFQVEGFEDVTDINRALEEELLEMRT